MGKYLSAFLAIVIILTSITFIRLSEFEISDYGQLCIISFKHHQDVLQGTLILPPNQISPPVVILVHGDGPQDRWSDNGYLPLVNYLVSQGIAVFSWDKPGVGASTGNWLSQNMSDRANEAAFALQILKEQPELKRSHIGYLGFSQAGWVIPKVTQLATPDFIILAGAAINWRNQGIYYTGQRLNSEGRSFADIEEAKKREAVIFDRQFTKDIAARPCTSHCTRQDFERRNSLSDATQDISEIHTPVFILMGKDDRNVNPDETIDVWSKTLPTETSRCIVLIPKTTHGLLRSTLFDYQLPSQWPIWKQGLFLLLGQYAYSPKVLNAISGWILTQQCKY